MTSHNSLQPFNVQRSSWLVTRLELTTLTSTTTLIYTFLLSCRRYNFTVHAEKATIINHASAQAISSTHASCK